MALPRRWARRARKKTKYRKTDFWRHTMSNGWTPERRARQAELIKSWKPWTRSTGPQTANGKTRVSRNAYKGGERTALRKLARVLRECKGVRELFNTSPP